MRAVKYEGAGGTEVIRHIETETPHPGKAEVLIKVAAAGLNRPDIQQRKGLYPPPPGASEIAGLDVAGTVQAVGEDVSSLKPGDPVCALVAGGAHAEFCVAPSVQCLPIPSGLSFADAAVLPEVLFTCWNSMVMLGRLRAGETLLFHGGTSGVGLACTQVARLLYNATVMVTAGTEEKRQFCLDFGASQAFDYRQAWADNVMSASDGRGVDLVLDGQAGATTNQSLEVLAEDGRVVLLASHDSEWATINTRRLVRRRLTLAGSTIRSRPSDFKGRIAAELGAQVWPLIESGQLTVPICARFPLDDVANAHAVLDGNKQIGKVVLLVGSDADKRPT